VKAAATLLVVFCLSIMVLSNQSQASPPPAKPDASFDKWEFYATDEENINYAYNASGIEQLKGNVVRVWVQAIYPPSHLKYIGGRFQWEINCSKKKMRGIQAHMKKKDGTSLDITESSDWSPIPAESTAETLYESVCKKTVKKKDTMTDKKAEEKKEEKKTETKAP
jgi:hypothetical protein